MALSGLIPKGVAFLRDGRVASVGGPMLLYQPNSASFLTPRMGSDRLRRRCHLASAAQAPRFVEERAREGLFAFEPA